MFKKLFLIVVLLSGWGANTLWAGNQIPMQIVKDGPASSGPTYAPPHPWYITQDDYVLTFGTSLRMITFLPLPLLRKIILSNCVMRTMW